MLMHAAHAITDTNLGAKRFQSQRLWNEIDKRVTNGKRTRQEDNLSASGVKVVISLPWP